MDKFEDFTDFKEGNWNGWTNGRGLPNGELKTENGNTFWSGILKTAPGHWALLQPSLFKKFSFQKGEEKNALYRVSFRYRVHERGPEEAETIAITIAAENGVVNANHTEVTDETPVGKWLEGHETAAWFSTLPELWICTRGGLSLGYRQVDFDEIRVTRIIPK